MSAPSQVLLIEDDAAVREVLTFNLEEEGYIVTAVDNGRAGIAAYDAERHDVVLTDLKMPGTDGMGVLREILTSDPAAVILMLTAYGSTDRAIDAMREGAFHYVQKPVNTPTLLAIIDKAVEYRRLRRDRGRERSGERSLIAASPAMNEVMRIVDKVADSDATILIRGESGTGKELVARALHQRSDRSAAPFVAVNCAAIPADLLESTLFGHEKGAFTGADKASPGKFMAAQNGTIFLDEIGEMSADLQSKLLRVLQEGEIDVVGSTTPRTVDVRIVAATHQALEERVKAGTFREDLFYRLNVVPLQIPPLRERREDIPVLGRFFIRRHEPDVEIAIDREVDDCLVQFDWPGNVRELENVIHRMLLLRRADRLTMDDLPIELRERHAATGSSGLPFDLPEDGLDLMSLERDIVYAALEKMGGNQSAAARYLGIPRHVLLYRLEKYSAE